ncbi:hypothetical protein HY933_01220 [Candidatus Falkowbacteria bacterium]|nr:hypothetical protein [Candidatus Falkowbacteria bacterium]
MGSSTYQRTIEAPGWERETFNFLSEYLRTDGQELLAQLGIENLDSLTPRQAMDLSTQIVLDLTKYDHSKSSEGDHSIVGSKAKADESTALELLREGQRRKEDPTWDGNGVCRNFASMVKAVFESLKANQTKFNHLRDTHCLYESGMEGFDPKRRNSRVTQLNESGHAWNTFVTIGREGQANASIVDVTWAKRDLDTRAVTGLDHTLMRMEPVIQAVGQGLSADSPEHSAQMEKLLSYYALKIETPSRTLSQDPQAETLSAESQAYYEKLAQQVFSEKYDLSQVSAADLVRLGQQFAQQIAEQQQQSKEKEFFVSRAVALMRRQGVPDTLPPTLVEAVSSAYRTIGAEADAREIETVYQIMTKQSSAEAMPMLRSYLKGCELSEYHVRNVIFQDDELQRLVFEELKTRPEFERFLKDSPTFRIRMREILPPLFVDFAPGEKPEDTRELLALIQRSQHLQSSARLVNPNKLSTKDVEAFFGKVRDGLHELNADKFESLTAGMDDYALVKNYDALRRQLAA